MMTRKKSIFVNSQKCGDNVDSRDSETPLTSRRYTTDDGDDITTDNDDGGGILLEEQSEEEKRLVRNQLRSMCSKIQGIQDSEGNDDGGLRLDEIMKEARNVISQVHATTEAIEDAKMFAQLCRMFRTYSQTTLENDLLSTERRFSPTDYAFCLARWVGAPQHKDGHRLSRTSLAGLGAGFTRASFGRTPTLKLLLGAMGSEERPEWTLVKERRRPAGHRAAAGSAGRSRIATVTKTSVVDRKSLTSEAKTDRYVKQTKKCLDDCYARGDRVPVCYFTFVIDPDSFGKTVENMFHVSFLVKQRTVLLAIGSNGMPTLKPLNQSDSGGGGSSRRYNLVEEEEEGDGDWAMKCDQAVISICQQDWQNLKTNLNITKRMITIH